MSAPEKLKDDDTPPDPRQDEQGEQDEAREQQEAREQDEARERRSPRLREPKHHRVVRPGAQFRRRAITVAGLLLVIVALLGFYTGAGVLSQVGANPLSPLPGTPMPISGVVTDAADNSVLEGVTVRVVGLSNENVTNAEGWYFLDRVAPGVYKVEASKIGYTTERKTLIVSPGIPRYEGWALQLGNGTFEHPPEAPPTFTDPTVGVFALGIAILLNSVLAALGGWSAATHRHYLLAVAGAAAGTATGGLAFGIPIGSALSVVALGILGSLKTGFLEAQSHHIPWESRSPRSSHRSGGRKR